MNYTLIPNQNHSNILAAIIAKWTVGDQEKVNELQNMLNPLDENLKDNLIQIIFQYGADTNLKDLHAELVNETDEDRFKLHKAADALGPQPPIDWVVEGLFSRGSVSIIVGDPGSKKTYSLLDLTTCVASGKQWLGFKTVQSPALLVDEESGKRRLDRRLGDTMRGHHANKDIPFQYVTLAQFNLRINDELGKLEELINTTEARLVIIDALADVMPGADENAVKDIQPLLMGLRGIAERTQSAILLIHHSNKRGNYRGSSALLGAVDVMITVKSKKGDPVVNFIIEKNRDGEPFGFSATANFLPKQFFLSNNEYKPELKLPKAQHYVLQYLATKGESVTADIKDHADRCSPASARNAIYELVDLGYVERVDKGGAGEKATYDITEKGMDAAKAILNL